MEPATGREDQRAADAEALVRLSHGERLDLVADELHVPDDRVVDARDEHVTSCR